VVIYAWAAIGLVLVVQIAMLVRIARTLSSLGHVDDRVSRLAEAIGLLADTAETGFRALGEQAQAAPVPPKAARRTPRPARRPTSTGRVVRQAKRGKSVTEIAAAEEVSEGEVRLRLSLAEAAATRSVSEAHNGAMRVE
jgi:hypothetical protein